MSFDFAVLALVVGIPGAFYLLSCWVWNVRHRAREAERKQKRLRLVPRDDA